MMHLLANYLSKISFYTGKFTLYGRKSILSLFGFILFFFPPPFHLYPYLQLKYFWVPRVSTFLHSQLSNPWQLQFPHPPLDSLNAMKALFKLSGQCSVLPIDRTVNKLNPGGAEDNHKWCRLETQCIYCYFLLFHHAKLDNPIVYT